MDVGTLEATLRLRDEMAAALKRAEAAVASFMARAKAAGAPLDTLGAKYDKLVKEADKVASGLTRVGVGLTAGVTAPAALAVKAAMDFEHTFAQVRKTVEGTPAQLNAVADSMRQIAARTPTAVTELNRIAGLGGQLGVPRDELARFTEVIAEVGVASDLTVEAAATSFAQFQNIMRTPVGETRNLGSAVIALGNNLATTESKIVEMAQRIAGAGQAIGLSEAQVLGYGAALSAMGIEAEAGGTAISRTFKEIAVAVATGSAQVGEFARVAGMSKDAFAQLFQADAGAATQAFIEGLARTAAEGGNVIKVLDEMGIVEVRQSDALLRLSSNTELLRKSLGLANDGWRQNTALAKEAALFNDTLTNRLKTLGNNLFLVGERIGKMFTPALRALTDALIKARPYIDAAIEKFDKLPTPVKVAAGVLLAMAAAAGPALIAVGMLANGVAALAAAGVTGAMIAAFGKVILVVGAVTAAIMGAGGLALALAKATGLWDTIRNVAARAGDILAKVAGGLGTSLWQAFGSILGAVWEALKALWGLIAELLRPLAELVKYVLSSELAMAGFKAVVLAAAAPLAAWGVALKAIAEALGWVTDKLKGATEWLRSWNTLVSNTALDLPIPGAPGQAKNASAAAPGASGPQRGMTGASSGSGFDPFGANLDLKNLGFQYRAVADAAGAVPPATGAAAGGIGKSGKAAKDAAVAISGAANAYRDMAAAALGDLGGIEAEDVARLVHMEQAMKGLGGVTTLTEAQTAAYRQQLGKVLDGFTVLKHRGPEAWSTSYIALQEANIRTVGLTQATQDQIRAIGQATPAVNTYAAAWQRLGFENQTRLLGIANTLLDSQIGKLVSGLAPALRTVANEAGIAGATGKTAQEEGKQATEDWTASLSELSSAFAEMAQISGQGMDGFLGKMSRAIALMNTGAQASKTFTNGMQAWGDGNKIGGAAQMATGAVGIVGSMQAATDKRTKKGRIAGGAMQGAAIGANPALMAMSGGTSVLIGAAAGAIWGAARNPMWADIADRVGKDMGVEITTEMAKSIEKTAKSAFGGNRQAAEIFHLGDLASAAGGITTKNFETFARKTRDAFVMLETGAFNVEQVTNTLGATFKGLSDQLERTGKIGSKTFTDLITLGTKHGALTEEMVGFVQKQTQKGAQGLLGLVESAAVGGDLEFAGRMAGSLFAGVQGPLGTMQAMGEFSNFLDAFMAKRDELNKSGNGLAGLGGLEELVAFRSVVEANRPAMAELANLDAILQALGNTGSLTADRLNEMATAGVESFARLTAGGMTPQQALKQMEPFLANIVRGYEQLGAPMDEQLTALVAQASQFGLLKDEANILVTTLTTGFEGVTAAVRDLAATLRGDLGGALNGLPGIPVTPGGVPNGGDPTMLAKGGILNRPTFVAGERGAEVVAPLSELWQAMDRRGSGGPTTVNLTIDLEGRPILRALLPLLAEELRLQGVVA